MLYSQPLASKRTHSFFQYGQSYRFYIVLGPSPQKSPVELGSARNKGWCLGLILGHICFSSWRFMHHPPFKAWSQPSANLKRLGQRDFLRGPEIAASSICTVWLGQTSVNNDFCGEVTYVQARHLGSKKAFSQFFLIPKITFKNFCVIAHCCVCCSISKSLLHVCAILYVSLFCIPVVG